MSKNKYRRAEVSDLDVLCDAWEGWASGDVLKQWLNEKTEALQKLGVHQKPFAVEEFLWKRMDARGSCTYGRHEAGSAQGEGQAVGCAGHGLLNALPHQARQRNDSHVSNLHAAF